MPRKKERAPSDEPSKSKWMHVDSAHHANVYTDRLKIPGGYLYLVTKMFDQEHPEAGARPYAMVFVPLKKTPRNVKN